MESGRLIGALASGALALASGLWASGPVSTRWPVSIVPSRVPGSVEPDVHFEAP